MRTLNARERLMIEKAFKGEIVRNDDGYLVYWPTKNKGYLTSEELQLLVDYLCEQNSEWDNQINEYFENEKKKENSNES